MKEKILDIASKNIELYGLKKFTIDNISKELKISGFNKKILNESKKQ